MLGIDPARMAGAGAVALGYAAFCLRTWQRHRPPPLAGAALARDTLLITFASQSGFGRELAEQAGAQLTAAGLAVHVCPLGALNVELLSTTRKALFIASTCGEGDAPDNAGDFAGLLPDRPATLKGLRYGLLALGDQSYAHYCGFGRRLDAWLQASGARELFPRLEVDRANAQAVASFHHRLASLAGVSELPGLSIPALGHWRIRRQQHLNPGSAGEALWRIELAAVNGADADASPVTLPDWQAGDLLELHPPAAAEPADSEQAPRLYSIASLPSAGVVQLLMRQVRHDDGQLGRMSALLAADADVGAGAGAGLCLRGRIRPHPNFQLGSNADRPLILIGSGSGLAGLLAHLRQRASAGDGRNWLVYGERNRHFDHHHQAEIAALAAQDLLVRHDLAFSRDQPGQYVQDCLQAAAATVRDWVDGGAAIYVCGSAITMGPAVHACLADILGADTVAELARQGRYRRDLF